MNKSHNRLVCLVLLLVLLSTTAELASAQLTPLAAGTFPIGSIVVPMDNKQADRIRVYGFIHEFLRTTTGAEVARIIEPPDVSMQTALTPTGSVYQGGPFLIDQKFLAAVNALLSAQFNGVTVTRLTAPFTSNQIFFVRQPTRILVIEGIWGRTDYTLTQMGINFTLVTQDVIEANPSLLRQYSLIVVDCPGWYGNPTTYTPSRRANIQNVYNTLSTHIRAGNEVIFTDIAMRDLNATFPGYVNVVPGDSGKWDAIMYNPPSPAAQFQGEFPSQYYNGGPNPNQIKIVTDGGGNVVSEVNPAHVSDVRILMDSTKFGVPFRYAILGFYFPFGNGIVEGLAFHPQEQLPVGSAGYFAVQQIYGNKFIHGPQIDFTVSITPPAVTVSQGQAAQYTVTVTSIGGFSAPVNLAATGAPPGSSPSITPITVTPPQAGTATASLTISTTTSTPNGTYTITVTGTSSLPAIVRTATASLTVLLSKPDFVLDVNPKLLIVNPGSCGNLTTTVRGVGTFNSAVNLTLTGLPSRTSVQYFPRFVTPTVGGTVSSIERVCATGDVTPGNYTLTLTGSAVANGSAIVHTVNLTLRVPAPTVVFNPLVWLLILTMLLLAVALALLALYMSGKRRRVVALVPAPAVRARPIVQYVLPVPTVRCRYCGRIMPINAIYCPHCGRAQVVMAGPPPPIVVPRKINVVAVVLVLLGGILVLLNSAALLSPSFYAMWSSIFFWLPSLGPSYAFALGAIIGLVLVMGAIIMALRSAAIANIIIIPFAVFSLIIGGGFIAGMLFAIIGGLVGVLKR